MFPYSIDREVLATMIASHSSGLADSTPEQEDYELADDFIKQIDERY